MFSCKISDLGEAHDNVRVHNSDIMNCGLARHWTSFLVWSSFSEYCTTVIFKGYLVNGILYGLVDTGKKVIITAR